MTSTGLPGVVVASAPAAVRSAYLRRVAALTFGGLLIVAVAGIGSMLYLGTHPGLLRGWTAMAVILGCWAVTNFVAQPMVFGTRNKAIGFVLGTLTQGIALGFLLLVAVLMSQQAFGNPFTFIGMAVALTAVAGLGITLYAASEKREFSVMRAAMAALSLPMLALMALSFAFPQWFGGGLGIFLCAIFVIVSAAGLTYQMNRVVHHFRTNMAVEGGYVIAIGVTVLFWNILSLLMRLNRR
jgi:FtsH-binding integral membrane protein